MLLGSFLNNVQITKSLILEESLHQQPSSLNFFACVVCTGALYCRRFCRERTKCFHAAWANYHPHAPSLETKGIVAFIRAKLKLLSIFLQEHIKDLEKLWIRIQYVLKDHFKDDHFKKTMFFKLHVKSHTEVRYYDTALIAS